MQAERCRLLVGPIDTLPDAPMPDALDADIPAELAEAVVGLRVSGNFMFDAATHRDFLGAVLGAGIDRSKVCSPGCAGAAALRAVSHMRLCYMHAHA